MVLNCVFYFTLLAVVQQGLCQVGLSDTNQARTIATNFVVSKWIEPVSGVRSSMSGGWDESNTARILTSLQLVENDWIFRPANKIKADLALKQMNSDILQGLLRSSNMTTLLADEGSEYVNALLATCQNPQDFFGHNLVSMLSQRINTIPSGPNTKNVGQVIAATLALCNAGAPVPSSVIQRINSESKPTSGSCAYCMEGAALAILAMKCLRDRPGTVDPLVQGITTRQIAYIKDKQQEDGGFGNLFATTLVVQATNAVGPVNLPINVASALNYIIQDQDKSTGSFGNPIVTGFVLPTLIGRSVLDVKTVPCPPTRPLNDDQPRSGQIRVKLLIDDQIYSQRTVDTKLDTNPGQTVLQIMNEQQAKHPKAFKFTTTTANGGAQLAGVNSVANDNKNNWSWRVLRQPAGAPASAAQPVAALDTVQVQNGDKIIFRFGRV